MSEKLDNAYLEIQRSKMKYSGVSDPIKVENFVEEIYNTMNNLGFSVIEFETIVNELLKKVALAKKIALKAPLITLDKYKKKDVDNI